MDKQLFVIIGLGEFGETIASELTRLGHEVLGIDIDERKVDKLAEVVTHAVVADVTDEQALDELNIGQYDVGVVAIGENIEASILATLQLKSSGVDEVWVKALTNQHHRILARLGATRIIRPEHEMGMRVAQALNYPVVNNYIGLGDDEYVVEIIASERLQDRFMHELIAETGAKVRVLLIKRSGKTTLDPGDDFRICEDDQIVLEGLLPELRKLAHLT